MQRVGHRAKLAAESSASRRHDGDGLQDCRPLRYGPFNGIDVARVHIHVETPVQEFDGEHHPRLWALSHESSNYARQWAADDLHHHALLDEWARVTGQIARQQSPDAVNLAIRNRRRLAAERHNCHHTGALKDRQQFVRIGSHEAITWKQWPVDPFLPIFPSAPPNNRGQERLDFAPLQFVADDLFVPGLNPFSSRVQFAGRSGALDMNVDLDNIHVQFLPWCLTGP